MQTFRVTVGADGRVVIPDTRPGETIDIQVAPAPGPRKPLTRTTALTDEERDQLIADIQANARTLRALLKDELPISTDELYGEDGLPA